MFKCQPENFYPILRIWAKVAIAEDGEWLKDSSKLIQTGRTPWLGG